MDVSGFGYRNAQAVAPNGDLAAGDGVASRQDPELVRFVGVERNHRPAAHPQQLLHRHFGPAQYNRNLDADFLDLRTVLHVAFPGLIPPSRT